LNVRNAYSHIKSNALQGFLREPWHAFGRRDKAPTKCESDRTGYNALKS